MKCPICEKDTLRGKLLEEKLRIQECTGCGGYWIPYNEYWRWVEKQGSSPAEHPFKEIDLQVKDSDKAKLCPDCGRILLSYKVGHGIGFRLDHCNGCNGVWLDKNEWEILKSRHFHDELHRIFTTIWQKEVREEETAQYYEKTYIQRFGEKDYAELKRVKQWLDQHPKKSLMLYYLNDPNPYRA